MWQEHQQLTFIFSYKLYSSTEAVVNYVNTYFDVMVLIVVVIVVVIVVLVGKAVESKRS